MFPLLSCPRTHGHLTRPCQGKFPPITQQLRFFPLCCTRGVSSRLLVRFGAEVGAARACPSRTAGLGAGRMGEHGPRDGNSPGHEWGRCSIHKCRVAPQPRRRWESPAGGSCSSLCQQIPRNSLLMLVLAPPAELRECRAGIAAPGQGRQGRFRHRGLGIAGCLTQLCSLGICSAKTDRAPGSGAGFPVTSQPPSPAWVFLGSPGLIAW